MKKISILILFLSASLFLTSCEENKNVQFDGVNGQTLVDFARSNYNLPVDFQTSVGNVTIPIDVSTISTSDRVFNVSVVADATTAGSTFYTFDSTVTVPAGSYNGSFQVNGTDAGLVPGEGLTLVLELSGSDADIYGANTATVNIFLVCPFDVNNWVGTYSVSENFTDGLNAPNGLSFFFSEMYQIEMALDPNDLTGTKVVITNSAGFNEYIPNGTIMTFDESANGVIFGDNEPPLLAAWNNYDYEDSIYDDCTFTIQCTGPLLNFGPYQFTFTKQ